MGRNMREIKSITVQGLGHWQIGDKMGDGVIWSFDIEHGPDPVIVKAVAKAKGWTVLAEWYGMPIMAVYGTTSSNPEWKT